MSQRRNFLASGAFSVAYILLLSLSIYLVFTYTLGSMHLLKWSNWGYSDLLINYDAGFVRRGLLGAIIKMKSISESSGLPFTNKLVFGNFLLLALLTTTLNLISRKRASIIALLVLMMPGGIFSMALFNEHFFRKEILFYMALSSSACLVCALHYLRHTALQHCIGYAAILLIFASGLVLPFVHESFLFLSAPANAFLLFAATRAIQSRDSIQKTTDKFPTIMVRTYLSIQVILFLLLSHYKGNSMMAQLMWDNLAPIDRAIIATDGHSIGAIETIGWSLPNALWVAIQVIISGFGWYWLAPLVGGFLYCLSLTLLGTKSKNSANDTSDQTTLWANCYLTLFIATIPLYILGVDWGRWINGINFSFIVLWLAVEEQNLGRITGIFPGSSMTRAFLQKPARAIQKTTGAFGNFWLRHSRILIASMLLFSFTFQVPECCLGSSWTVNMATSGLHGLKRIMKDYRSSHHSTN